MKKLTRERIYEIAGGNRSTYEISRAIEAEVLRINGEENGALRNALQVIAAMPIAEQDNMISASMRKIAAESLKLTKETS